MTRTAGNVTITLSVLDRLLDKEPKVQVEAALTRSQALRSLRAGVQRDLEWLLNTRRIAEEPDESLKEVNRSLFVYGLPDLSNYTVGLAADRAKLSRQLLSTLKLFEPRLLNVQLTPIESPVTGTQELKFRIEGLLAIDPSPEPVSFDTLIDLKGGTCTVTGGPNAG